MADSLKATVTNGIGSYAHVSGLSMSATGICYVGFQVYVPTATQAGWLGGVYNDSPMLAQILKTVAGGVDYVGLHDSDSDDVYDQWETNYEGTFGAAGIAGAWHQVEWLREPTNGPGPYSLKVDGVVLFTDPFGPIGDIGEVLFGAPQQHSAAPASGDVYVARIRIGTTDGGSDIFDWDASTVSDLSDFSSLTGTVVLASAPSPPPAWGAGGGSPDSVKATLASGGSWIELAGLSLTDAYIKMTWFMPAASQALWLSAAIDQSPWILEVDGASGYFDFIDFTDWDEDDIYDAVYEYIEGEIGTPSGIAGSWHTLEWIRVGSTGTVKLDGVTLNSDPGTDTTTITKIKFGLPNWYIGTPFGGDFYISNIQVGSSPGTRDILYWCAGGGDDLSSFSSHGTVVLESAPVAAADCAVPPDGPGAGSIKRFRGYPWRFIFTDLEHVVTTWAQGIQHDRRIGITLNSPTGIDGSVQSDDRRVNTLWTDGYPRVAQTIRMVHCFRREAPAGGPPWIIKAAGILEEVQDEGDSDVATTHWNAFDPWSLIAARPVMASDGSLPDPNEGLFLPYTADVIAGALLANTITNEGTCFIDAGPDYGGTAFWGTTRPDGTHAVIETCDQINITAATGQMVADIWNTLVSAGVCDIALDPIWDPINRPGYTHELSIRRNAGSKRPSAVFAWDRLNRNLSGIDRMHDAQPGQFMNKADYFVGQGGPPANAGGPLINAASVSDFGSWWATQFFPTLTDTDPSGGAVLALARQALVLSKQGKRTLTITPITDRAPVALVAYRCGDRVPVYASKRLRVEAAGLQRVQGIPIAISDDDIETIGGVLCSPDFRDPDA